MNDLTKNNNLEETLGQAVAEANQSEKRVPAAPSLPSTPHSGPAGAASTASAPSPTTKAATSGAAARVLPEVVNIAIDRGIRVVLTKEGYEIDGFYKGGPMRLEPDTSGHLAAFDRKDKKVLIKGFDDLVKLNYDWWKKSRDKGSEFINPSREWTDEFVRLSLVKRQVIFIPGED